MARLTKTEAARQLGIARSTLYKLIAQGALSPAPDGLVDSAELVRVAPLADSLRERSRTSLPVSAKGMQQRGERHEREYADTVREQQKTTIDRRLETSEDIRPQPYADMLVELLQAQLRNAQETAQRDREAAYAREQAYHEHIAHLTTMLEQAYQQNQRLLEMPREAPVPPPTAITSRERTTDRGAMRQRIVSLLQEHPEGLSPAQIRVHLGVAKRLAHTCVAMARDGLLRKVGTGRYGSI